MDTDEKTITCQMCGQAFKSQEELDKHNKEKHGMNPGEGNE